MVCYRPWVPIEIMQSPKKCGQLEEDDNHDQESDGFSPW